MPTAAYLTKFAILAACYFGTAKLGQLIPLIHGSVVTVWPPSGVALAFLFLFGLRFAPAVAAGGFLLALSPGISALEAGAVAIGDTSEAVLGTVLLHRIYKFRCAMNRVRDVFALFVPVTLSASALSATVGIVILGLGGNLSGGQYLDAWLAWCAGDIMGIMLVAPLLFTGMSNLPAHFDLRRGLVLAPFLGAVAVLGAVVFHGILAGTAWRIPLLFGIFPLLAWVALRYGPREVAAGNFMVAVAAISGLVIGELPFETGWMAGDLMALYGFLAVLVFTTLVLTAMNAERYQAEAALRRNEQSLSVTLDSIGDGVVATDERGLITRMNPAAEAMTGWSLDDAMGRPFAEVFHLTDTNTRQLLPDLARQAIADGNRSGGARTLVLLSEKGMEWPVADSTSPIRNANGEVIGAVLVLRDRSAEWAALVALRESEERFRATFELAPVGIAHLSLDGRFLRVNRAFCEILGYTAEQLIGADFTQVARGVGGENGLLVLPGEGAAKSIPERRYRCQDGSVIWGSITVSLPSYPDGAYRHYIVTLEDITTRKRTEQERLASEQRFRAIFENASDAILLMDGDSFVDCNPRAGIIFGGSRERILRLQPHELSPAQQGDGRPSWEKMLERIGAALCGAPQVFEWTHIRLDNSAFDAEVSLSRVELDEHLMLLAIVRDVTDRKRSERLLRDTTELQKAILDSAAYTILATDAAGTILTFNAAAERLLGYGSEEVVGLATPLIFHDHGEVVKQAAGLSQSLGIHVTAGFGTLVALASQGLPDEREWSYVRKDGSRFPVLLSVTAIRGDEGRANGFLFVGYDITERKQAAERIEYLATRDPLTELPNRLLLEDRVAQGIIDAERTGKMLALLFLDLDRFKTINDSLGHPVGDQLLQQVAQRLSEAVRDGDTVARLGGDEFVLLLRGLNHPDQVEQITLKILHAVSRPYLVGGQTLNSSCSIGIGIYPHDGRDLQTLLRNADTAMYHAKGAGRNSFQFFSPEMNVRAVERLTLEGELRRALAREEFVLHFQPLVTVHTGQVVGMEALIRWAHPGRGLVQPQAFVALAEETGLIVPLGEWVIWEACGQCKSWLDAGFPPLRMAVNLSVGQFNEGLAGSIAGALRAHDMPPGLLDVEITESLLLHDVERNVTLLRELGKAGVQICVDDFGTGYSSLGYLAKFPINALKIDRSFMTGLNMQPGGAEIVRAIIAMAKSLDMRVIAEGVEDDRQLAFLRAQDCDEYQGMLFSGPLPPMDFERRFMTRGGAAGPPSPVI